VAERPTSKLSHSNPATPPLNSESDQIAVFSSLFEMNLNVGKVCGGVAGFEWKSLYVGRSATLPDCGILGS